MKEKTYQDFLNDCAKELGFEDFAGMIRNRASNEYTIFFDLQKDAGHRYANHVKAIALQEGYEKGCKEQKTVCAEHANVLISNSKWAGNLKQIGYIDRDGSHYEVNKDSILNAPNAANPYTKELAERQLKNK